MQNESQWHNDKGWAKSSLKIYVPLTLLQGFEKVIQGLRVRGGWRPNRNCNTLTPTLMAVNVVSFSFSRAPQPEAQRPTLLGDLLHLISNFYAPQLNWGPRAPLDWCGFPYHISSITPSYSNWNSLSWLSYIIVQCPLNRLLDLWNGVWSSSSRNNCHAVHRSLSSGASVYEYTMGIFFTSSHFISQFPPTRFPLITAIRMCHFLPVHQLGMAFLAGSKAKIQHLFYNFWHQNRRRFR